MNQEKVSLISTGVNLLMAILKLAIGLFITFY